ncbi:MAG: polyhydroxyalkanoate biosynthesis repressor PhaR [Candidatus Delongbacteria bacterium]|nr:polyhydroxyalkanoate biosynthesis repressor PhaR [Candidatus Delongbacteria bacterium]
MKINNRKIGINYPPLVIVELGINHGGSLQTAFKMVDLAYDSGAEIIKHQTHIIDDEMSGRAKEIIPGNADISIYEIMKKCALNEHDEIKLKEYIESKGMTFLSTPFSREAANRLERMGVCAYKIGSGECNNYPLIEHIASFSKPMIVSTGMNSIESIRKTVEILEKYQVQYALLHTTNLYPTPSHLVRLGAMQKLQQEFPNAIIGLSDHTTSNLACFAATALGANILERHFTDKMTRTGPDILNSMDPKTLKELILGSNEIAKMRFGKKEPLIEEQVTIDFAFATVVTIRDIKKGEIFTKENIWVKRPGNQSIKAEFYNDVLGKFATRDITNDEHLNWSDIGEN